MADHGIRSIPNVRVNLLPAEVEERRQLRQVQIACIAAVGAAVVVVVMLFLVASKGLSTAEKDLVTAQEQERLLIAEDKQLASINDAFAQLSARETQLTAAMGQEVRFSEYLSTIRRTLPERVWLSSFSASLGEQVDVPGSIGSFTFTGRTISANQDDVAVFLESLTLYRGFVFPYTTSIAEGTETRQRVAGPFVYDFTSTVAMTADARSNRFTTPGGPK